MTQSGATTLNWRDAAAELEPSLVTLQRAVHADPETGLDLPRTQQRILDALRDLPLEITLGQTSTSVVAVLRGRKDGGASERQAVLLRADMDALPVEEATGLPYASKVAGVMHACGHDLHLAALVGAAHLLAQQRDCLPGDVVFMFQPGEETSHGARCMLDEGLLNAAGSEVVAAYALHVFSGAGQPGVFFTRGGSMCASSDSLKVTIRGRGGHGASPHLTRDPVPALAAVVTALQTMVAREFDVHDPVVVTVGMIRAGTANNIIPESGELAATLRTFSAAARTRLLDTTRRVVEGVAAAHGLRADVELIPGYPSTINDPAETDLATETVEHLFGPSRMVRRGQPLAGAEDFSYVLDAVPGNLMCLWAIAAPTTDGAAPTNHAADVVFADSAITDGAAYLAAVAAARLQAACGA